MKAPINNIMFHFRNAFAFCIRHTGLNLVYLGVLLFAVFYLTGITNHNIFLYIPLLLIILGITGFVHNEKAKEKY